ncbi:MarR family winged helix-turn-helix transcriptional regulator [Nocardia sp. NPDC059691]|uniref:MarR family winged helix-turn-helix transcriptional regulator n=1 Tax=Nocardia sp. NPDC059691 TaxID=3346908 RepID=UPI0036C7B15F
MPEFLDLHGKTNKAVRAAAEAALRAHGLHLGQDHLLAALWERDGRTPGELAATLNVSTPTVVKMATRMAEAGLLERRRDDKDSRLVRLRLLDEGRRLRTPIEAERRSLEDRLTASLTSAERDNLLTALAKIHRAASGLIDGPVEH